MANGDHEAASDEQMRFAERDATVHALRGTGNHEQAIAVAFELWPLVRRPGILDGERMQAELGLDVAEQLGGRFIQADPDEVSGTARPSTGFVDRHVGDTLAVGIGCRHHDSRPMGLCDRDR